MPTYEIHYFPTAGRSDLHRMMIEVGHVRGSEAYKNVFVDGATWPEVKKTMAFGMVPKLVVVEDDGSRKELFETSAIDAYLAESLGLMPGSTAFERAEALSVLSAFRDLEDKVHTPLFLGTAEERKRGLEKAMSETVPKYLHYQERFVRGDWYFGDKMTVADLKVYTLCLFVDDMLGTKNPIRVLAAEFPKLNKIIKTLEGGKAGEYAKARRDFGCVQSVREIGADIIDRKFGFFADECKWGPKA